MEAGGFPLHLLVLPALTGEKPALFRALVGGEKAPRPCLRLAEARVGEGLVNSPHRIIHNLYYMDTEYSQTVSEQIRQAKQLVSPSEND